MKTKGFFWHKREKLAWAAGIADGEGHWHSYKPKNWKYVNIRFEITQTDREILDRFCKIVGVGKVYGPWKHCKPRNKEIYRYVTGTTDEVKKLTKLLYPWLGSIKKVQADNVLKRRELYDKNENQWLVLARSS